jgi:hypothetical protein
MGAGGTFGAFHARGRFCVIKLRRVSVAPPAFTAGELAFAQLMEKPNLKEKRNPNV